MREDNAICTTIKRIEDLLMAAGCRPYKDGLPIGPRRQDAQVQGGPVKRGMLCIKHQAVQRAET
jgi:hypothetical protein